MGLSIARTIVEAHHGQISAKNRDHGGASFRIWLPLTGDGWANQRRHRTSRDIRGPPAAERTDGKLPLPGALQYPSLQRYCHARPTAVKSLPVRVVMPVLVESFSELLRSIGNPKVKPARVLRCSLSLLTPFRLVRPPEK